MSMSYQHSLLGYAMQEMAPRLNVPAILDKSEMFTQGNDGEFHTYIVKFHSHFHK